jgi:anti-sigma factor RsiW
MTNDINKSDLDWLAFCYAAGELDAPAAEQFESRLADDQRAREALARAVELTQTVAAAESQCGDFVVPAATAKTAWNSRLSWMAVGGLASVLVALLWSGVVGPTWQTARQRLTAGTQYNLAMAWQQTGHEIANVKAAGMWPSVSADDDEEFVASDSSFDEGGFNEAPSWMMAAVFSVAGDPDSAEGPVQ